MSTDRDTIAVGVRIRGRVQGVFFRAWTEEEATRLGLSGRVKNEADGSVVALFIGPAAAVEEMLDRCREGPPAASVSNVETSLITPVPEISGFHVTG